MDFFLKLRTKQKIFLNLFLIILIVVLGIFGVIRETQASWFEEAYSAIKSALGGFLLAIQGIVGLGVTFAAGIGQGVLSWTDFQKATVVQDGWRIVRNLSNLFFALVLLIIAFATILRLETYGMKQLLWKLIVAALLINFSLVIAGVFVDFSGVLTNFFMEKAGEKEFFTNIADTMGLPKTIGSTAEPGTSRTRYFCTSSEACHNFGQQENVEARGVTRDICEPRCKSISAAECAKLCPVCCEYRTLAAKSEIEWDKTGDAYWHVIGALLLSIFFSFIALFVFLALALLLLIRILFIWFLLILAPIVWLFWILPATTKLFTQWWNQFIKWCFFAPIAVFFIFLAIQTWQKFLEGKGTGLVSQGAIQGMKQIVRDEMVRTRLLPQVTEPETLIQFVLVCAMLIGSLIVAQKMGVAGAEAVIATGKGLATGVGRGMSRWAARGAPLMPKVVAPALRKIGLERAARGWEKVSGLVGAPKRAIAPLLSPHAWGRAMTMRRARADERSWDLAAGGIEDILEAIRHPVAFAQGRRTYFKQRRRAGLVEKRRKEIAHIKDEDQLVQMRKGATDDIDREALDRQLTIINGINTWFASKNRKLDPVEFQKYLDQTYGPTQGPILGADISAIAGAQGNYSLVGASEWNRKKQRMDFVSPERQAEIAVIRARELDPGKFMGQVHPDSFFSRDPVKGHTGEIHLTGEALLRHVISPAHSGQAYRLQPRAMEAVVKFGPQIEAMAKEIGGPQEKTIKDFVKAVRTLKGITPPPPGEESFEEREKAGRP